MEDKILIDQILSKDGAKLYFVGIGGIAMSAAANIATGFGYEVLGSDSKDIYSPAKDILDQNKIKYAIGYNQKNVFDAKADLYILSAGETPANPEVKYILDNNLPHIGFAKLLYELSKDKLRIIIAGTHGKSTTAGLLGHLLKNLDDSSFMTGAVLQNYQSNFYKGGGHYFIFEGDEYKSEFDDPTPKFHYYKPDILVLTNLEYDHPDQFASLEDLKKEFELLLEAMPEDGLIIYNADDANISKLVHKSNVASASFGIDSQADFKTDQINFGQRTTIEVRNKFSKDTVANLLEKDEEYTIQLPGKMNVYNALAAIATLRVLGFSRESFALNLVSYQGVKRRFEVVGVKNGVTIIDDYAHHPTAVRETLGAARLRHPKAKIWAVFEPHTYSRTKATLSDLVKSFDAADEILISEIYPARESTKDATINSQEVVDAVKSHLLIVESSTNIRLARNKQDALDILKKELKSGDVVVIMAVGSFNRLAYELREAL